MRTRWRRRKYLSCYFRNVRFNINSPVSSTYGLIGYSIRIRSWKYNWCIEDECPRCTNGGLRYVERLISSSHDIDVRKRSRRYLSFFSLLIPFSSLYESQRAFWSWIHLNKHYVTRNSGLSRQKFLIPVNNTNHGDTRNENYSKVISYGSFIYGWRYHVYILYVL